MDGIPEDSKERLEIFYREQYDNIVNYIDRRILNREDAQDIAQDAFASCCRNIEHYDAEKSSLLTWLYVIVNNRLKNYYRDKKIYVDLDQYTDLLPDDNMELEAQTVYVQMCRDVIAEALKELPERSRKVVVLAYFEQRASQEIADEMGISSGNVRAILSRALKKMRKTLDKSHWDWKKR